MTLRLYYFPTLNAHKVTIALEEMELAYELRIIDIPEGRPAHAGVRRDQPQQPHPGTGG